MKAISKIIFVLFAGIILWGNAFATHNKAGELTYRQIGKFTYEVTLVTYTDTRSARADRPTITIGWGDGTSTDITRLPQNQITLPNFTWKNIYIGSHTYSGPGEYIISFEDPNRVDGILNMDNSVGTQFYIESLLIIDPRRGFDQSPVLLNPPIDNACVNQVYTENPNAYDADGDSLVFTLIPPRQAKNQNVSGYVDPQPVNSFHLDKYTGQITWSKPAKIGIYNVAILIQEFRNKIMIGYIVRDMQINVIDCPKFPPIISQLRDTCIEAGTNFNFIVPITAKERTLGDSVKLIADGGSFRLKSHPSVMIKNPAEGFDSVKALFEWQVQCEHIRRQPYLLVFKAINQDSLSAVANMQVKIVGPAPTLLQPKAAANAVTLTWKKPNCPDPVGYFIYRRSDSSLWKHATCEIGVPGYVGYHLIDTVYKANNTVYVDSNRGAGLAPGIRYCYVVTAFYLYQGQFEAVEGYASNEFCAQLNKDVPVLTHASVRTTSATNGSMYVDWSKPIAHPLDTLHKAPLDTTEFRGPYTYKLYHSPGINTSNYKLIFSVSHSTFAAMNDTIFIDSLTNTEADGYTYKIEFYYTDSLGKSRILGKTIAASSVFLKISRAYKSLILSWSEKTPWENDLYTIFRWNTITSKWDSIGNTPLQTYKDSGLENGREHCYYVRSTGSYKTPGFVDPIINLSQTSCSSARDTVKPCPPILTGKADCDSKTTQLNWTLLDSCTTKVVRYKVYYSVGNSYKFGYIDSIVGKNQGIYTDERDLLRHSLAGCYYVTAIDSYDNESIHSDYLCVDNCPRYALPNVITPNGDDFNDKLTPINGWRFISSIDLKMYNRWGQEVFKTNDPEINWDGTDETSHLPLADGVYYYTCIVHEIYFEGIRDVSLKGAVTILRHSH